MSYKNDLVSVIIPTYKRADKLKRAIDSVCSQTYDYLEILVVNDNDNNDEYTKSLVDLIESIEDSRVRLVFQEKHINGAAARNAGIKVAKGEYIAFLDDDDIWHPQKIEKQIEVMKSLDESYGAVSTMFSSFLENKIISKSIPYKDGLIWEEILLRRCDVTTCSVLIRHKALDETGYFDESLRRHQEIQILAFLSKKYKIFLLQEYLLYVDAWGENNPKPEKILGIKKDFFASIEPLLNDLPLKRQNDIKKMHYFEVAYIFFKHGRYINAIKYSLPLLTSINCMKYAIERVRNRKISKDLANNEK